MTANVDAMVREAIRAYRAGQKPEARALLERATEMDEFNEQAWLWLSAFVETPEDQRTCLENVLYINPDNANAKKGLEVLNAQLGPAAPAAADDDDPLASASFGGSSSSPFTDDDDEDDSDADPDDFPVTATSSASSVFVPPEPSKDEYDDWVANLNIGGGGDEPAAELDDDAFASAFADDFGEDIEETSYSASAPSSASSTYGDIDFGFDEDDESGVYQPSGDLDDLFGDSNESFGSGPFSSESIGYDTDIDIDTDLLGVGDEIPASPPPRRRPARQDSPRSPARETADPMISTSEFYIGGEEVGDDVDPSEYFHSIPRGIKPTRVPGMDERYPALVVISLLLLVVLNVGALAMLVINMSG